jgi:hypothetical protein
MRTCLALAVAVLCAAARASSAQPAAAGEPLSAQPPASLKLRDGDLVFQTSRSTQSEAVALATRSRYTHMGVVLVEDGRPMVLEAVEPVKLTAFEKWVERGEGGRVVVKRLKAAEELLTPAARARMRGLARKWTGRHYDAQFRWDDQRLYCSELVYKLLDLAAGIRIGKLQRAKEMNLAAPGVQTKLRERFGGKKGAFNPEEIVISPQSMFDDPKLETLFKS